MNKRKKLRCPVCGFDRLIDSSVATNSELVPEDKILDGWVPDYFQKCPHCKSQIGIKKVV